MGEQIFSSRAGCVRWIPFLVKKNYIDFRTLLMSLVLRTCKLKLQNVQLRYYNGWFVFIIYYYDAHDGNNGNKGMESVLELFTHTENNKM